MPSPHINTPHTKTQIQSWKLLSGRGVSSEDRCLSMWTLSHLAPASELAVATKETKRDHCPHHSQLCLRGVSCKTRACSCASPACRCSAGAGFTAYAGKLEQTPRRKFSSSRQGKSPYIAITETSRPSNGSLALVGLHREIPTNKRNKASCGRVTDQD